MWNSFLRTTALSGAILAGACLLAPVAARAAVILTFGQSGSNNTITATNPTAGTTTITGTAVPVVISQLFTGGTPINAILNLSLTNAGAISSTDIGGITVLSQAFDGSFSFTNGATNYLSATFHDLVFGIDNGSSLTLSATTPPTTAVTFTSNVLPLPDLSLPRAFSFGFANVKPTVNTNGGTLGAFTASIAGTASANASVSQTPVPEPMDVALLGAGLIAIGLARRPRHH